MKRLLFLSCALILAGAVLVDAGRSSGANVAKLFLSGTVYDTNHSVIASSQVVAQDFEGKEYSALTNDEGVYKFELPFATYRIEANAPGFCPKRVDVLRVRNSLMQKLDFVLEVEPSDRPCTQKTMIKKEQPRKPDFFRSIAE
jgi:Carboxypeptidase regulatory-like domain